MATEHEHVYGFCEEYDAYYCRECHAWLEPVCDDPACEYCPGRPMSHAEVVHAD